MAMVKKITPKKTGGRRSSTLIQSPIVKRVHSRPVTLQGWLQKRGSDGLMFWKKRWFVLSDYCLFYYKDPEEDTLLGSFVLASWIISPCTHKDKVYKKYSFKAEHNNMRTYYFAADNDVSMAQWLKALTMASLLQDSPRPLSKITNIQMNQLRHKEYNAQQRLYSSQIHAGQMRGHLQNADNQPLYVNAPPKPKRLNDDTAADSFEEESKMMFPEGASSSHYIRTMSPHVGTNNFPQSENQMPSMANNILPSANPMTCGLRSPSTTTSFASHYETLRTSYTLDQISTDSHPPRPRSVDFLEYENKNPHKVRDPSGPKLVTLPRRPKSSMSITAPKDEFLDAAHWSEESYAKKMRESSMYVTTDNENSAGSFRSNSSQHERNLPSPSSGTIELHGHHMPQQKNTYTQDQGVDPNLFQRSASARLPELAKEMDEPYDGQRSSTLNSSFAAGESNKLQQREESMKRLLEWKERMLHSPSTQKQSTNIHHMPDVNFRKPDRIRTLDNCADLNASDETYGFNKINHVTADLGNHSTFLEQERVHEKGINSQMVSPYNIQRSTNNPVDNVCNRMVTGKNEPLANDDLSGVEDGKMPYDACYQLPSRKISFNKSSPNIDKPVYYQASNEGNYCVASQLENNQNGSPLSVDIPESFIHRLPSTSVQKMGEGPPHVRDEEWGLKLDESSVIKEYSYHYIKNDNGSGHSTGVKVGCTITNQNELQKWKKEPIYNSCSRPTPQPLPSYGPDELPLSRHDTPLEAHTRNKAQPTSILKNMKAKKKLELDRNTDINKRKGRWDHPHTPDTVNRRQVFSDTETLLYETSSEIDDKEKHVSTNKYPNTSSDDDRDEEVAAVLAKEREPSCCKALDSNKSPSSVRLFNNDIESDIKSHVSASCENVSEIPEENYMPMTPRKRNVPASPFKDSELGREITPVANSENEELPGIEECPYVEMTQNGNGKAVSLSYSLNTVNQLYLNQSSPYFSKPSDLNESERAHYGAYSFDVADQEPLYMEVSSRDNKSAEFKRQLCMNEKNTEIDADDEDTNEGHTVSALPDILNTTAPSLLLHGSRRSDSSDADDEASKDLDSIDAPRHPRFSLSDTFRPASYYLGSNLSERAIIALNSDHPDSSDSDLVSPPPIPACSPPLEDLDTSIDSTINNRDLYISSHKDDFPKKSGSSDKFRYTSSSKHKFTSSNTQIETASSEEESVKSERNPHYLKRRPLSADILNSLSDFNVADVPSSKEGKGLDKTYEHYETKLSTSSYSEKNAYSNSLPLNPLLKQGTLKRNSASRNDIHRDWNQANSRHDVTNIAQNSIELANINCNVSRTITPERKFTFDHENEPKRYALPLSDASIDNYENSAHYSVGPDEMNAYVNANILVNIHESPNNAPYYYSDLFKVDSKNSLHRMNKGDEFFYQNSAIKYLQDNGSVLPQRECYYVMENSTMREQSGVFSENMMGHNADEFAIMHERFSGAMAQMPSDLEHHTKYLYVDDRRLENHRRTRSLEGLLDSPSDVCPCPETLSNSAQVNLLNLPPHHNVHPSYCQDQHHNVGAMDGQLGQPKTSFIRQSRSLENLEKNIDNPSTSSPKEYPLNEVVYTNSNYSRKETEMTDLQDSTEKEKEKIRQWDSMSSAPSTLNACMEGAIHKENSLVTPFNNKQMQLAAKPDAQPLMANDAENLQKENWSLKFSAGDLLGRTHEELVLLLIQLRRQRAAVCKSMEQCHREIEAHACLTDFDSLNRLEHIQKLDELKSRLIELEKQYEKGKPLVNLVDNMVKLGSLYQSGPQSVTSDKLEFNYKVQEERILADERRDWERIRADHQDLQAKVEQLYRLDKLLQEESGTLHSLQEDKGVLEKALGGLKSKLQGINGNTAETEWYRRQQRLLERELSRVRSILALNSKKLEETVAENARLEQELVVLRQKLQLSRRAAEPGGAATAILESELSRVQLLVGNLLRQRQELSAQVRQLTEKSNSLSQQIWPSLPDNVSGNVMPKKKPAIVGWIETDLDTSDLTSPTNDDLGAVAELNFSPLYVNTNTGDKQSAHFREHSLYEEEFLEEISSHNTRSPDSYRPELEDDSVKRACSNSNWKEKPQEIKTVRIVKRESERRQRDRDHRSGNIGIPLPGANKKIILEEPSLFPISEKPVNDNNCDGATGTLASTQAECNDPPPTPGPRTDSVHAVWNIVRKNKLKGNVFGSSPAENAEPPDYGLESPQLSPVYLSETARKIVEEVAWQGRSEKRLVPRERRRHHTVSGLSLIAPKFLFTQKGSRDDLDMERVLRPRLTTPDVVRSTLNRSDTNFTKETIDNILGAPGKIVIPERYIPESQPQLSEEEMMKRSKKADAIRKMLCETATVSPKDAEVKETTSNIKDQVEEEKRNREHLLQLSQILAQEVMEKSKIVAIKALAALPLIQSPIEEDSDSDDLSPISSLPLYQQRENFYS